jgi:hypothetical protein
VQSDSSVSSRSVRGKSPTSRSPRLVGVESPRGLVGVGSPWGMGGSPWGDSSYEGEARVSLGSPGGQGVSNGGVVLRGGGHGDGWQRGGGGLRAVGESPRGLQGGFTGAGGAGVLSQQVGRREEQQLSDQMEGDGGWLEPWGIGRGSGRVEGESPVGEDKVGFSNHFNYHQQQQQPRSGPVVGEWSDLRAGGSPRRHSPRQQEQQQQQQQQEEQQQQQEGCYGWEVAEDGSAYWSPEWPSSANGSPHAWQQNPQQQQLQEGGYYLRAGSCGGGGVWDPDWPASARSSGCVRGSSPGSVRAHMVQKQQQLEQEEEEQLRRMGRKKAQWWQQEQQQQYQDKEEGDPEELIKAGRWQGSSGASPSTLQSVGGFFSQEQQQQQGTSRGRMDGSVSLGSTGPTGQVSYLLWPRGLVQHQQQQQGGTGRSSPLNSGSSSRGVNSGSSSVIHSGKAGWGSPLRYTPMFDEDGSPRGAVVAAAGIGAAFPAGALKPVSEHVRRGGSPSAGFAAAGGRVGGGGQGQLQGSARAVKMESGVSGGSGLGSAGEGSSGRAAASRVVTGLDGIMALVAQLKGSLAGLEHDMQELRSGAASPTVLGEECGVWQQ